MSSNVYLRRVMLAAWMALLLALSAWGLLALHYSDIASPLLRRGVMLLFTAGALAAAFLVMKGKKRLALTGFAVIFCTLVLWWRAIPPSNARDWQTDVSRLAYAEVDGERVTIHNIRNFNYRSEFDYIPAWYDKTYDLGKLRSVDLIAVYWMGPAIAHTMLSFGFEGGDQLAISIETRKERGEAYSTLKGFFKQYELYYVVADERDVIRLRTNYRLNPPEDTYLYRVRGPAANARRLFLAYVDRINSLHRRPEFYNTLVDNCTTGIWMNTRINPGHLPLSWKILASGYVPHYLYAHGRLENGMSFEALRRRAHVNARARAADQAADFSRLIRLGLPGYDGAEPGNSAVEGSGASPRPAAQGERR